jgi:hypothetical protein
MPGVSMPSPFQSPTTNLSPLRPNGNEVYTVAWKSLDNHQTPSRMTAGVSMPSPSQSPTTAMSPGLP